MKQWNRRKFFATTAALGLTAVPPTASATVATSWGTINVAIYGAPQGVPVLYFHGVPGSAAEARLIEREAAVAGVSLIALDRPGMGASTYDPDVTLSQWPSRVLDCLEALGLGDARPGILSMSGGAPFALHCAAATPDRFRHVAIVSGLAPVSECSFGGAAERQLKMARKFPCLARRGLTSVRRALWRRPQRVLAKLTRHWTDADRREILENPIYRQLLLAELRQSFRCGIEGIWRDLQLIGGPWCLPCRLVTGVKASVWQGTCDRLTPPSMGAHFHRRILASDYHRCQGAGHVTTLKWHAADILTQFVA